MAILRDVTPLVEPLSLDEAFLDVSGAIRLHGRPGVIAAAIRARVVEQLGLTCSVGVAPTKFVAKLASARCKPDGMLVVPAARVARVPAPAAGHRAVGRGRAHRRAAAPPRRPHVGDLAATPLDTLRRAVGSAAAEHLSALAHGIDPRPVEPDEVEKSISADRTLDADLTAEAEVRRELLRLAEEVGQPGARARLRRPHRRHQDPLRRLPHRHPGAHAARLDGLDRARSIETAVELYRGLELDQPRIRLVGVKCEGSARGRVGRRAADPRSRRRGRTHTGTQPRQIAPSTPPAPGSAPPPSPGTLLGRPWIDPATAGPPDAGVTESTHCYRHWS